MRNVITLTHSDRVWELHTTFRFAWGSTALFCPTCGDIWARRINLDEPLPHMCIVVPCEQHPDTHFWRVAGSLNLAVGDLARLPRALLLREVVLHLNHFNRLGV